MSNAVQLSIMSLFNPESLILLAVSTLAGIIIGALPGLTATMGVSLLVSTTLGLGPANALVVRLAQCNPAQCARHALLGGDGARGIPTDQAG